MHHPYPIVAPAEDRSRTCPCGAAAERPWSLCRKCGARYAWRRKVVSKNRRTARRLAKHQARASVRHLTGALRATKGVD
jgi:hypothetical protein